MKASGDFMRCSLLLLVLALLSNRATAATPRPEYGSFESVCAVVQLEVSSNLETLFVKEELEYDLGRAVSGYFESQGTTWPVDLGSSCFPRNVSTTSKQLSLIFHVTLTDQLPPAAVTGAVIVHAVFALDLHLPHDYPTSLFNCIGGDDPRTCVSSNLASYFTRTIVPLIETGRGQRSEGR
jgi:hypothetical protein